MEQRGMGGTDGNQRLTDAIKASFENKLIQNIIFI